MNDRASIHTLVDVGKNCDRLHSFACRNIYSLYERKRTASKKNTEEMVIKKKKLAEKKDDPNASIRRRGASKVYSF